MNVASMFLDNARRFPDKLFLIDGEHRFSFSDMAARVHRVAKGLRRLGARQGDVVGIYIRNRYEWVELFYAASLMGAIVCPLNFRLKGRELNHVVNDAKVRFLVYDRTVIADLLRDVVGQAPAVESYIHLDEACEGVDSIPYGELFELAEDGPDEKTLPSLVAEDIHMVMYTSGTTGLPKGVLLTHFNSLIGQFFINTMEFGLTAEDTILVTTPLCHRTGFARIINAGGSGSTAVLMREFRAETALDLIAREQISVVGMVPTMLRMIFRLQDVKRWDRSSVQKFLLTGEACPPTVKEQIIEHFPNARIFTYFASTEAGQITTLRHEDQIQKSLSVGHPIPGIEVKIVDAQDRPVGVGESGEILVRSGEPGRFTIMKGYLNNSVANAESFVDGWFRTGDVGLFDDEGYLYVTDRKKDMILSGGLNIYSKEVENTIAEHPSVVEAAVVGVPDPEWGEAVLAFVVPVPGTVLTADEIIEFCKQRLAGYKKPRYVRFLDQLPKNSVGKVLKYELREEAKQGMQDAG